MPFPRRSPVLVAALTVAALFLVSSGGPDGSAPAADDRAALVGRAISGAMPVIRPSSPGPLRSAAAVAGLVAVLNAAVAAAARRSWLLAAAGAPSARNAPPPQPCRSRAPPDSLFAAG